MNINPIVDYNNDANPETNVPEQPIPPVFTVPDKPLFIHNTSMNPFIKTGHFSKTKPVVPLRKFNTGFSGRNPTPILNEHGIKHIDFRSSKIEWAKLDGHTTPFKNYNRLRNHLLGIYQNMKRDGVEVPYCRDVLSIHGVGSKQGVLAIIRLVKNLKLRLNMKLRLKNRQHVILAVASGSA